MFNGCAAPARCEAAMILIIVNCCAAPGRRCVAKPKSTAAHSKSASRTLHKAKKRRRKIGLAIERKSATSQLIPRDSRALQEVNLFETCGSWLMVRTPRPLTRAVQPVNKHPSKGASRSAISRLAIGDLTTHTELFSRLTAHAQLTHGSRPPENCPRPRPARMTARGAELIMSYAYAKSKICYVLCEL